MTEWPEPWTKVDSEAAMAEGWDIFDLDGGGPEIAYLQDPHPVTGALSPFGDDIEAIAFVVERAKVGSEMHQRALRLEQSWDHFLSDHPYPTGKELWP